MLRFRVGRGRSFSIAVAITDHLVDRHDAGKAEALVAIEAGLHEVVAAQIIEHVGLHEPDLHHRHSAGSGEFGLQRARERQRAFEAE